MHDHGAVRASARLLWEKVAALQVQHPHLHRLFKRTGCNEVLRANVSRAAFALHTDDEAARVLSPTDDLGCSAIQWPPLFVPQGEQVGPAPHWEMGVPLLR